MLFEKEWRPNVYQESFDRAVIKTFKAYHKPKQWIQEYKQKTAFLWHSCLYFVSKLLAGIITFVKMK